MISQNVIEPTESELFAAFTLEFEGEDGKTHDLWTVQQRHTQMGQVVADYDTQEIAEFVPNTGSVIDSSKLDKVVRENRVAELAEFYQNQENLENENSIFD